MSTYLATNGQQFVDFDPDGDDLEIDIIGDDVTSVAVSASGWESIDVLVEDVPDLTLNFSDTTFVEVEGQIENLNLTLRNVSYFEAYDAQSIGGSIFDSLYIETYADDMIDFTMGRIEGGELSADTVVLRITDDVDDVSIDADTASIIARDASVDMEFDVQALNFTARGDAPVNLHGEIDGFTNSRISLSDEDDNVDFSGESNISASLAGGDDTFRSDEGNDVVNGGAGDDFISTGDGNDVLNGGTGSDQLYGGFGNDKLIGGDDGDLLFGGSGDDILNGGDGDDDVVGGYGNDRLIGGAGEDQIDGGYGNDRISAGEDRDEVDGGDGNDIILGEGGDDELRGDEGNDTINGGDGNDYIHGGKDDDVLVGLAGNDEILGGDGNDLLNGGADDDMLDGGAGDDTLVGGAGSDSIATGSGTDFVNGGAGRDTISSGAGDNIIYAGADNDEVNVFAEGSHYINGGTGNDEIRFVASDEDGNYVASSRLEGGSGYDVLIIETFQVGEIAQIIEAGTLTFVIFDNPESSVLTFSGFEEVIYTSTVAPPPPAAQELDTGADAFDFSFAPRPDMVDSVAMIDDAFASEDVATGFTLLDALMEIPVETADMSYDVPANDTADFIFDMIA